MRGNWRARPTTRNRGRGAEHDQEVLKPYWGYEDLGIFCLLLVALGPMLRLLERVQFVEKSAPQIQCTVILFLLVGLYAILKIRYRQPVVRPLGWVPPHPIHLGVAAILGSLLAGMVALGSGVHKQPAIPLRDFDFLVSSILLGPMLEESLFRGCLLPVLHQSFGPAAAVTITAFVFALFHGPPDLAHWASFTATGCAYGWLRLVSRSTTAAALMHATYNLVLILALPS